MLNDNIPVLPQTNGLLDNVVPLRYEIVIRVEGYDASKWDAIIPVELGLEYRIVWFE